MGVESHMQRSSYCEKVFNLLLGVLGKDSTINEAFPLGLVMGEHELSNVFKTLVKLTSICEQTLENRLGVCARIWGHTTRKS